MLLCARLLHATEPDELRERAGRELIGEIASVVPALWGISVLATVFTVFSLRGPNKTHAQNMIFIILESDFTENKMQGNECTSVCVLLQGSLKIVACKTVFSLQVKNHVFSQSFVNLTTLSFIKWEYIPRNSSDKGFP